MPSWERGLRVGGLGGSPFSNLLCAPSTAPAASSLSNPRRDTYRGRTAPRGRAGRLHRGPTSQGPWPRRERAGAEGQQSTSTWPQAGLGHIQLRVAVAPGFSAEALGARECNSGTLRGEGASQASPVTSSELEGAQLRAGGASTTPDWCPLQDLCSQREPHVRSWDPAATRVSGAAWSQVLCLPATRPSSNPNSL